MLMFVENMYNKRLFYRKRIGYFDYIGKDMKGLIYQKKLDI